MGRWLTFLIVRKTLAFLVRTRYLHLPFHNTVSDISCSLITNSLFGFHHLLFPSRYIESISTLPFPLCTSRSRFIPLQHPLQFLNRSLPWYLPIILCKTVSLLHYGLLRAAKQRAGFGGGWDRKVGCFVRRVPVYGLKVGVESGRRSILGNRGVGGLDCSR